MKHCFQQQGLSEFSISNKCLFILFAFNPTNPVIRVIVAHTRVKDHLGSTRAVWAPDVGSGQLTEATGYLPYGTQVPIITPTGDEATREKFTGKELDKDGADAGSNTVTGVQLDYFGKRYYDGITGRWVEVDPREQFLDAYNYCADNPITHSDKDGSVDGQTIGKGVAVTSLFLDAEVVVPAVIIIEAIVYYGNKSGPPDPGLWNPNGAGKVANDVNECYKKVSMGDPVPNNGPNKGGKGRAIAAIAGALSVLWDAIKEPFSDNEMPSTQNASQPAQQTPQTPQQAQQTQQNQQVQQTPQDATLVAHQ